MQTSLFSCALVLWLVAAVRAQSCPTEPDVSCTEDVAATFLSIHNSVAKRTLTARGLLDVVFVIDEGALQSAQHYWTKQFLLILSEIFVISPDYTRVGVVTYSSSARIIVPLASKADICTFTASINNMTMRSGSSYLTYGLNEATNQLNSGRSGATKLTIVITNGDWGNLGSNPQLNVNTLRNMGYFSAIILKHPLKAIGLQRDVIFDYFVSFFGSKKLGFTAEMTPHYLRDLHSIVQHNKAVGTDWPLDMEVNKTKCTAIGRTCAASERCICEVRTIAKEYICIAADVDPPEAVACKGPKSPIILQPNTTSVTVTWTKPLFSDNSGVVTTVTDRLPGLYQVGTYKVTSTASDQSKNTATCSFTFTVSK